jgi:hypothetical protein
LYSVFSQYDIIFLQVGLLVIIWESKGNMTVPHFPQIHALELSELYQCVSQFEQVLTIIVITSNNNDLC